MRMLRIEETLRAVGNSRTQHYGQVASGLFTRPVKLSGCRACGWPEYEVEAIVSARIAGVADAELRELVDLLHERRQQVYESLVTPLGMAVSELSREF